MLVDAESRCRAWLSLKLDCDMCGVFGVNDKETIIYEFELLAACLALDVWNEYFKASYQALYTDNDSVRNALVRGVGLGLVAGKVMNMQIEVANNTNAWFARVPTEASIADIPSRFQLHPFLEDASGDSNKATDHIQRFIAEVDGAKQMKKKGEVDHLATPQVSKKTK